MMLEIIGGPWPERIGRMAYEVTDDLDPKVYPRAGRAKGDLIVFVVNDPLDRQHWRMKPGWSCVLGRADVREIGPFT